MRIVLEYVSKLLCSLTAPEELELCFWVGKFRANDLRDEIIV